MAVERAARTVLIVCCLIVGAAAAEEVPITIEADRADIRDRERISVFRGDVVVRRGDLTVWADTLTLHYQDTDDLDKAVAEGAPARFIQKQPDRDEIRGEASQIDYLPPTGMLYLTGNAKLWQDPNRFASERIQYDTQARIARAGTNDEMRDRVHMTIEPKEQPAAPQ